MADKEDLCLDLSDVRAEDAPRGSALYGPRKINRLILGEDQAERAVELYEVGKELGKEVILINPKDLLSPDLVAQRIGGSFTGEDLLVLDIIFEGLSYDGTVVAQQYGAMSRGKMEPFNGLEQAAIVSSAENRIYKTAGESGIVVVPSLAGIESFDLFCRIKQSGRASSTTVGYKGTLTKLIEDIETGKNIFPGMDPLSTSHLNYEARRR